MNRISLEMGRAGGIMLLALLLSAATFWLWHVLTREAPNLPDARRHTPDYYIIDMVRHTMDRNGDLQNVLMADEVYHYPDDNSTALTRPRM